MFQDRARTCDFLTRTIFFIRNFMRILARLIRVFRLTFMRAVLYVPVRSSVNIQHEPTLRWWTIALKIFTDSELESTIFTIIYTWINVSNALINKHLV